MWRCLWGRSGQNLKRGSSYNTNNKCKHHIEVQMGMDLHATSEELWRMFVILGRLTSLNWERWSSALFRRPCVVAVMGSTVGGELLRNFGGLSGIFMQPTEISGRLAVVRSCRARHATKHIAVLSARGIPVELPRENTSLLASNLEDQDRSSLAHLRSSHHSISAHNG
jgi:hypothetical protein